MPSPQNDSFLLLRALVDELARCGVAGVCTSPGSRSTPLVLTLAADERLTCFSHIDERAAGFFAVGLARATGRPAVLACTSGTAAANYLPAVIEAHEAGLPLIVLTADRPPELRDVGAGQSIDQLKLYGSAVRWFQELDTVDASPARLRWMRQLACRAAAVASGATGGRPGPVHLNVPLREPLVLTEPLGEEPGGGGRDDGAPWTQIAAPAEQHAPIAAWLDGVSGLPGVIVAGTGSPEGVAELAAALDWPLLADPLSGLRHGEAAIAHYDLLLRSAAWAERHRPGAVLRVGALPTSKPLRRWLANLDCPQAAVAATSGWQDPDGVVSCHLPSVRTLPPIPTDERHNPDWPAAWRAADEQAARALAGELGDALAEPNVARACADAGGQLVVASSMPIREVEAFFPTGATTTAVHANRGANGIDGTIATAYGIAAAAPGVPTRLLIGDVAFTYDLGGLATGARLGLDLTIVLVDNGGGGIFDHLPVGRIGGPAYEEHIATAPGLDVAHAAAAVGAQYEPLSTLSDLQSALTHTPQGTTVLHVRTVRADNVALHQRLADAVSAALV